MKAATIHILHITLSQWELVTPKVSHSHMQQHCNTHTFVNHVFGSVHDLPGERLEEEEPKRSVMANVELHNEGNLKHMRRGKCYHLSFLLTAKEVTQKKAQ